MRPMPRDDHDHDAADAAAISRQKMLTRATIGLGSAMGAIIAAPAAVAVLAPVFVVRHPPLETPAERLVVGDSWI